MGIATFPASSAGLASVVKSVQRGTAATSGNITITAVNVDKTQVFSFSTGSAGTVAATGTVNASNGTASAHSTSAATGNSSITIASGQISNGNGATTKPGANYSYNPRYGGSNFAGYSVSASNNMNSMNINAQNVALNATSISGGSTSLTTAVYGVYLVNSTTLTATGACRYEVVEYF
jgi:hypothetical protein